MTQDVSLPQACLHRKEGYQKCVAGSRTSDTSAIIRRQKSTYEVLLKYYYCVKHACLFGSISSLAWEGKTYDFGFDV